MAADTLQINDRALSTFLPIDCERNLSAHKNYLFDLSHLGMLELTGDNAASYLQGQISCDVEKVDENTMQQGILCSLKGRILSLMDVIDWNGLKLILPQDLLALTLKPLSTAALLSKVNIQVSKSYTLLGYLHNEENDLCLPGLKLPLKRHQFVSSKGVGCYKLSDSIYMVISNHSNAENLKNMFSQNEQLRGSYLWHLLKLQHGGFYIYPETRGEFLPHRLELHEKGYIDFNKGCYRGQEIIARTHYLAKLKHKLKTCVIEADQPVHAGDILYHPETKQEVGRLIDCSPMQNHKVQAVLSVLKNHNGLVRVGETETLIQLCS